MYQHPISLTFDIEDWTHPELVRGKIASSEARTVVCAGTEAILRVLDRHDARGTFFILGEVARRFPELIRRIANAGHEIASHGHSHTPLWRLDSESLRDELRNSRAAIRDALNEDPVRGFRAPTFSLDHSTSWALAVLAQEGFDYDSSIFPRNVKLYGVTGGPLGIYRPAAHDILRHDPSSPIVEFPIAIHKFCGVRLPIAGGFYLRTLPLRLIKASLDKLLLRRPASIFLHPWECAANIPRVPLGLVAKLITYSNLSNVLSKLEWLAARYTVRPMIEILAESGHLQRTA